MGFENGSSPEQLAAEQAAGRAAVAKAQVKLERQKALQAASAAGQKRRSAAHRAPIIAKALAKLASGRKGRKAKALANFEAREASLKKRLANPESSYESFRRVLWILGLDHKGDQHQER
jgi:hypothetical protein